MLVQIRTGNQWAMSKNILSGRYDVFSTQKIPTRCENTKFYLILTFLKVSTISFNWWNIRKDNLLELDVENDFVRFQ